MSWPNRKWKQPRKRFPYRRCAAEPYAERKMAIVGAAWAVPGSLGAGILRRGRVRPATAVLRLRGAGRVGLCPPLLRRPCLLRGRRMTELAKGEGILKRYAPQYPASGAGRACPGRRSRRLVSSSWTVRRSCGEGISALSAAKMPRRQGPRPPGPQARYFCRPQSRAPYRIRWRERIQLRQPKTKGATRKRLAAWGRRWPVVTSRYPISEMKFFSPSRRTAGC